MKYRSDFVTNSSSSSFIIAYQPELKEGTKSELLLSELLGMILDLETDYETESIVEIEDVEDYVEYLNQEISEKIIKKASELKEKGYKICSKQVGYHSEMQDILEKLNELPELFQILHKIE